MGIRVALRHRTRYRYDRLVGLGPQVVRLRPAPHCRTPVVSYSLAISPSKHFLNWQQDPHGNFLARLVFPDKLQELSLDVEVIADLTVINPFDFFLEPEATEFPFEYPEWLAAELKPFRTTLPVGERLAQFLAAIPRTSKRTIDFLVDVNRFVQQKIAYLVRLEPGVQSPEETLKLARGSCRDSAWLLVQVLRNLGFAARFVSGYLIQLKPDVKPLEGPAGAEQDFTDLHAWTEVYLPGAGWVGLDATSGLLTGEGHLPLAATPEPASAAPITGAVDESEMELDFQMEVVRVHEDPRVTLPYTDAQWARIEQLGHDVDAALAAGDVRLTMGGEPTFVSIRDMESAEWNTSALGEGKRRLADDLFRRLSDKFATGPLMHFGQGKWYPGESPPRWALGCYWRADKQPIWNNPELTAADDTYYGYGEAEARRFVDTLAEELHVGADSAIAGYEDAFYYLWKERRLPVNVDPFESNLADAEERARLAKVFEQGLDTIVGFALPLRADSSTGEIRWESGPWFMRSERMYLIPGDSPMGFRLPLDSIPWVAEKDAQHDYERDPFDLWPPLPIPGRNGSSSVQSNGGGPRRMAGVAQRVPLRQFAGVQGDESHGSDDLQDEDTVHGNASEQVAEPDAQTATAPQLGQSARWIVRTALCVEARGGVLHVFMPPFARTEEYLELVAAVERTATRLAMPVRIEGYTPPHDPRLKNFKVTPDPGVIEVNLQPASGWGELVELTTTLYDQALRAGLGTEKFMLDGRHTGTGGGNHLVLGGESPHDSPFLRRPDLLKSLITFWNNHPSLSYLFSGLFIGPTSQAPRADEARHENVYELETAIAQLPKVGNGRPWIVDRVLRHLLVDVTGNTHRTEFCIDKLYAPESSSGRLGLIEFRAFEMPPHARMSLTQQLVLRALIARFWNKPYETSLVRWGTTLHDKFMLPYFVALDFQDVLIDLADAGFALDQEWFAPHFEFRFPLLGEVTRSSVHVELRQAVEPWHVLGEEPAAGGTARYVDSSVERLQVRVRGLTGSRFIITCNGRRVPLHPTGTRGEYVAGVRYRAWQPPSCLHPTIGVHAPLVFDIVDTWNGRSIGGCTWHVAHPGGRNFETFPVNAQEAESRRAARFFAMGHTAGPHGTPPIERNRDFPFTLDLRRPVELAALGG
jgi:uncharacterized protein (DUF2126 family)/transglutaminase-like putative cysteine protease